MRIKSADDKSKRLALLEQLQQSMLLNSSQKKWLREELIRTRKGIQGERDAAHYIDNYLKASPNHVVVHDLRLVVDGEVAQIDHLIINRGNGIFLLETKNYSGNLMISGHGEFTVEYDTDRFGIPSPIEQSFRHERVLSKLLERLDIAGRTQKLPEFHHVVMMHPKAIIQRPSEKIFDTSNVIKADQFPTWHKRFANKVGVGEFLNIALNMRSLETIKEWGEKLVRQHNPTDMLALPDFMKPQEPTITVEPTRRLTTTDSSSASVVVEKMHRPDLQTATATSPPAQPAKRLVCAHCDAKISFAEGKFCWNNNRFGGLAYCREHQTLY